MAAAKSARLRTALAGYIDASSSVQRSSTRISRSSAQPAPPAKPGAAVRAWTASIAATPAARGAPSQASSSAEKMRPRRSGM